MAAEAPLLGRVAQALPEDDHDHGRPAGRVDDRGVVARAAHAAGLVGHEEPVGQPGGDLLAPLLLRQHLDHEPAGRRRRAAVLGDHRQQLGHVARRTHVVERLVDRERVVVAAATRPGPSGARRGAGTRRRSGARSPRGRGGTRPRTRRAPRARASGRRCRGPLRPAHSSPAPASMRKYSRLGMKQSIVSRPRTRIVSLTGARPTQPPQHVGGGVVAQRDHEVEQVAHGGSQPLVAVDERAARALLALGERAAVVEAQGAGVDAAQHLDHHGTLKQLARGRARRPVDADAPRRTAGRAPLPDRAAQLGGEVAIAEDNL